MLHLRGWEGTAQWKGTQVSPGYRRPEFHTQQPRTNDMLRENLIFWLLSGYVNSSVCKACLYPVLEFPIFLLLATDVKTSPALSLPSLSLLYSNSVSSSGQFCSGDWCLMILILKGLAQRKVTKRISGHLRVEENALACRVQTADRICGPDLSGSTHTGLLLFCLLGEYCSISFACSQMCSS